MIGAILGDIVGEPYEFDRGDKTKDFGPLFHDWSHFTDDTVLTVAVADALLKSGLNADVQTIKNTVVSSMRTWGHKYPGIGYGNKFNQWLQNKYPEPYNSYGNGSAMRVSSVGWLYDNIQRVREVARATAIVTHNHPEGIKGAEATAAAIFLARQKTDKQDIKQYVVKNFKYDLSRTLNEIRPTYKHVESCQETVPEAITAFLEGNDFEDVVRNAVSLGGDCDTLTCIASSIAEAYYGVPEEYKTTVLKILPEDMIQVYDQFIDCLNDPKKYNNITPPRPSRLTNMLKVFDKWMKGRY